MCETITYEEGYWTVCWKWIFPYPCKKYRTVTKWCCFFSWIKETRWGVFCTLEGCADGQLYKWTAFCFGLLGTAYFYNLTKCFSSAKSPKGSCTPVAIGRVFEGLLQQPDGDDSKQR
ncbi:MAG: hypothetical protein IH852_12070 [Bacteroidetes bacterium]|nr:hypothetical protein [Bacteroidota bacterium]